MNPFGAKDKVPFNVTGITLTFEAPQGRPSSDGTVTLIDPRESDDSDDREIVSGTASRAAITTTLTAAAGVSQSNPKNVPVSPPAALKVGDFVWLTNASSQSERAEVAAIGASTVTVRHPLALDYATGATFASAVMSAPAVPSAWIADEDNIAEDFWAEWVYTVSGVIYRHRSYFDVVREIVDTAVPDSILLQRHPDLKRFGFIDHPETWQPLVTAARRDVDALCWRRGLDPDRLRGTEVYKYVVELRAHVLTARAGVPPAGRDPKEYLEEVTLEYERMATDFVEGKVPVPYDDNEDDVNNDGNIFAIDLIR